jgi:hypothetical protein
LIICKTKAGGGKVTRFEKLTSSPEILAVYIEFLVCFLLEDPTLANVERRIAWLKEELEEKTTTVYHETD